VPLANAAATIDTAYQTLNANIVTVSERSPTRDHLTFFHPVRFRAGIWLPPEPPVLLDRTSLAAVLDPSNEEFVLMVMTDDLVRRAIADDIARSKLIAGTQIPRLTASEERPVLLLQPGDGVIGITVLRLMSPDEIVGP
jgi:hypothetical protein